MSLAKKIYLSPVGYVISFFQNLFSFFHQPFMVYGFKNRVQSRFMKNTRISSSVKFLSKNKIDIDDNVWVGHFSVLDGSNGIKIEEGVQTGSHISIYSHSSHIAIRLLGRSYLETDVRIGYVSGKVKIGRYTFIGDSCVIFPNVSIGKGCLIKSGSIVTQSIPDFSIVSGVPGKVVGSVIELDRPFFTNPNVRKKYFDQDLLLKEINSED